MDNNELAQRRTFTRLALLNGLIIGLALAAGLWLPALISLAGVPTSPLQFAAIAVGALLVVALCILAGWLTGRLQHTAIAFFVWLLTGVLVTLILAYRPNQLSNVLVWLLEPGLYGEIIYPPNEARIAGIVLSGLIILIALALLALLQQYRLEGLVAEWQPGEGLTTWAWLVLLLPGALVFAAGLVTGNIFGAGATSRELQDLERAIEVARTYDGDLFARGLEDGINYAALRNVQDRLGPDYTLILLGTYPELSQTIVTAHFENGAWINCRFINQQLTFCDDAPAPYTIGFSALITGREPDCEDCLPQADEEWQRWLAERRDAMGPGPQITFLRQRGSFILMRAAAPDETHAITCWFEGLDHVSLVSCQEARP